MDSAVTKDSKVFQTTGGWGWGQRGLGASAGLVLGGLGPIHQDMGMWWPWAGIHLLVGDTKSWGELLPCGGCIKALGSRAAGFKVPELMFSAPGGQSWGLGVSRAGAYPLVGEAGPRASASPLLGRDSPRVSCCRHGGFRAQ